MTRRRLLAVACVALIAAGCGDAAVRPDPTAAPPTTVVSLDPDRSDLDPGPAPVGLDAGLLASVAQSAVRFSGEGCRRAQIGSGFVVAQDLVATNAHVVAGVEDLVMRFTSAEPVDDIDELPLVTGTVVGFDAAADIALVAVPTGERPILPLSDGDIDEEGFVLGFGGSGAPGTLDPDPFRVNRRIMATGEDIYRDEGENRRPAYLLAADIEQGDSGGALVRSDGVVIGMAFASSRRGAYGVRASVLEAQVAEPTIVGDPARCIRE